MHTCVLLPMHLQGSEYTEVPSPMYLKYMTTNEHKCQASVLVLLYDTGKFWLSYCSVNTEQNYNICMFQVQLLKTESELRGTTCQYMSRNKNSKTRMHMSSLKQIWDGELVSYNLIRRKK